MQVTTACKTQLHTLARLKTEAKVRRTSQLGLATMNTETKKKQAITTAREMTNRLLAMGNASGARHVNATKYNNALMDIQILLKQEKIGPALDAVGAILHNEEIHPPQCKIPQCMIERLQRLQTALQEACALCQ